MTKNRISDVRIGSPEVFAGRWWIECEYRYRGKLRIKQFSDVTEHAVAAKAKAFANTLLPEKG